MSSIVGRKIEIEALDKILNSNKPELLAVYGRRRVGKSFLINEYFKNSCEFIEIIGTNNTNKKIQIQRFLQAYSDFFQLTPGDKKQLEWDHIFIILKNFAETNKRKKIVIFFDEVPWLDTRNSKFLSALEYAWNKFFSKLSFGHVKIIICGSSASWMIKKIINSKAGMHNRLTAKMRLMPFTLLETKEYFKKNNIPLEERQIIDLYMTIGGIPKYLSYVKANQSIPQIVEDLIFQKDGALQNEFEELYSSLFDNYQSHLNIVKTLSASNVGMAQNELIKKAGLPAGGSTVNVLRELEESGFILAIPFYGQKKKNKRYRLVDQFSHFYLKWVSLKKPNAQKNSWHHISNSASYKSWAGYQFENICLQHIAQLKQKLGIGGVYTESYCWYNKKAQIDLLIERADKTINVCEIKYYESPIEKSKDLETDFQKKIDEFKKATNTKKLILKTLISTYGLKTKSTYINQQIELSDLFMDSLI